METVVSEEETIEKMLDNYRINLAPFSRAICFPHARYRHHLQKLIEFQPLNDNDKVLVIDFRTKDIEEMIDYIYFFSDNSPAMTYFDLCCRLKDNIYIFFHCYFSPEDNKFNYKAWYSYDLKIFINKISIKITPKYYIYNL